MNHSTNSNRNVRLGNALIRLCGFGLAYSSIVKFVHPRPVVEYMGYLGFENGTLLLLACAELLIAAAILFPRTRSAGIFLASSYLGGAIAVHVANHPFHGGGPFLTFDAHHHYLGSLPAAIFLTSGWIGVWLRHPESRWSFHREGSGEAHESSARFAPSGPYSPYTAAGTTYGSR